MFFKNLFNLDSQPEKTEDMRIIEHNRYWGDYYIKDLSPIMATLYKTSQPQTCNKVCGFYGTPMEKLAIPHFQKLFENKGLYLNWTKDITSFSDGNDGTKYT